MAIVIAKHITAIPVEESIICLNIVFVVSPNVVSMVLSKVKIDTLAAIKVIVFAAEYTGLLYFLYLTKLTIAKLNVQKVYAAIAIVVIIW